MSEMTKTNKVALLRNLQILAPALMIAIGGLVYWLWDDDMAPMIGAVIAFLSIPDFLAFKLIADNIEGSDK